MNKMKWPSREYMRIHIWMVFRRACKSLSPFIITNGHRRQLKKVNAVDGLSGSRMRACFFLINKITRD